VTPRSNEPLEHRPRVILVAMADLALYLWRPSAGLFLQFLLKALRGFRMRD
jgi:hypothetical protein